MDLQITQRELERREKTTEQAKRLLQYVCIATTALKVAITLACCIIHWRFLHLSTRPVVFVVFQHDKTRFHRYGSFFFALILALVIASDSLETVGAEQLSECCITGGWLPVRQGR